MVQGERAKGRAGIEGEGDVWNHFPYPCPSGKAHHKKLFQMKKSENVNGHEAIRRKKKVRNFLLSALSAQGQGKEDPQTKCCGKKGRPNGRFLGFKLISIMNNNIKNRPA